MSKPDDVFQMICDHARGAAVLHSAADALEWDERTRMPVAAGEYRAKQISMIRAEVHKRRTDPGYGEKLAELSDALAADPHSDVGSTVRELQRDWNRDCKLPTDLVQTVSVATTRGQQKWDAARKANDFGMFRSSLKEIIGLKREVGERLAEGTNASPYEALIDEYEPDASVEQLSAIFDRVRVPLVELIKEIQGAKQQPNVSILKRSYDMAAQRAFSQSVAAKIGFDFLRGRLDETSHPFCTTLGPNDCRILTRYETNWLPSGLFGTLHEAGHGMYEQGLRAEWFGLPPGSYASLGIHESQSRLWENQVGRSRPFWDWLYPEAQKSFPSLNDVGLDEFYFAVNAIRPSLIRVEADEATYNLHILIRFDLERQLIHGELSVDDLPEAWNDRYESDLGIRPASDADGVLQDVHWSAGLFGYFPTYTLGNLVAAQLYDAAEEQLGGLDNLIRSGDFLPLLEWLRENVHHSGRTRSGPELVHRVTGNPINAEAMISYLSNKLRAIYAV